MKKILIVDDHQEFRELVGATLVTTGHKILMAENAVQAIEIARTELPDLIIMDVMMPGAVDGVEAARILKNDPRTVDCTVVILSAATQEVDVKRGLAAGADDYLSKPVSPSELLKKVRALLR